MKDKQDCFCKYDEEMDEIEEKDAELEVDEEDEPESDETMDYLSKQLMCPMKMHTMPACPLLHWCPLMMGMGSMEMPETGVKTMHKQMEEIVEKMEFCPGEKFLKEKHKKR